MYSMWNTLKITNIYKKKFDLQSIWGKKQGDVSVSQWGCAPSVSAAVRSLPHLPLAFPCTLTWKFIQPHGSPWPPPTFILNVHKHKPMDHGVFINTLLGYVLSSWSAMWGVTVYSSLWSTFNLLLCLSFSKSLVFSFPFFSSWLSDCTELPDQSEVLFNLYHFVKVF